MQADDTAAGEHASRTGYLALVRSNRDFRNLWLGQVVSELGDWFTTVALFNLLLELTHRVQAVSWLLILMHLPALVMGPLAGMLVDRLDRKRLMIVTNLVRAVLMLCYIFVRRPGQVWLVYAIAATESVLVMLFEPARTASIPNICPKEELIAANALSSVTWSVMLTCGSALGGLVTAVWGREISFAIDSLSFVVSAWLIRRVTIPPRPESSAGSAAAGLRDVADGFRYLRSTPPVLALMLVKTGWCLGGGLLSVLSVFGQKVFPIGGSGAAGIGVLFAARGVGTALGPILARRLGGERRSSMRRSIAAGFVLGCVFYIAFGQARSLTLAWPALLVAHMGGSITWVFSTVLLQLEVPDAFRGRVFALEFALLTLAIALSNYVAGYALDVLGLDPRIVATLVGVYFALPAVVWIAAQRLFRK